MAELVAKHMAMDTPYSDGTVQRIKVKLAAQPGASGDGFVGGQISGIVYNDDDTVEVIVERGRARYVLTKPEVEDCRLALLKYIIFNNDGEFALINSPEFSVYYEMAE
jgi:hypothetical protein